jgi:mRNA interferase MazF
MDTYINHPFRGEVYMAEIGSNIGFEFCFYHPVLIIQNDFGNGQGETTIVLPITDLDDEKYDKNIHQRIYNSDLVYKIKNGLDKEPSKVKIADILTIDKVRIKRKVGKVSPRFLRIVERKLSRVLDLK